MPLPCLTSKIATTNLSATFIGAEKLNITI